METLNLIKNYLLVTWQRLKSDSPRYWRRFTWIAGFLALAAGFLTENDAIIPEKYKFITKYVTAMSLAAAFVSKLATVDPELAKKSEDLLLKENAGEKLDNI
jgi:hypothetical protein